MPWVLLVSSGGLFLVSGVLVLMPADPWGRLRQLPKLTLRVLGLGVGLVMALGIGVTGVAFGASGITLTLLGAVVLLTVLVVGVYLPGTESRRHARRRKQLDLQTIDLASYLVRALASSAGDVSLLREYARRPRASARAMQDLVRTVVEDHQRAARGSVWDVLARFAQESGSSHLVDVASTMREVGQQDRRQMVVALQAQRTQLLGRLLGRYTRAAQRNENLIIAASACSLLLGAATLMMYVMTDGLMILQHLPF